MTRLQVRQADEFSRVMAQTTWPYARVKPFGKQKLFCNARNAPGSFWVWIPQM